MIAVTLCWFLITSANALRFSNDSGDLYFTGSGSSADDHSRRRTFADVRDRQATRLQVDLGDAGRISVRPRRRGDVEALDVLPDDIDAECVVELRACASCWIGLTATVDRFHYPEVGDVEDNRSPTTGNNASESSDITCRLCVDTLVIEELAQMDGDGTVLTATLDDPNDVIRWNYTSRSSVLVMRASGRHSNRCRRGLIADIHYTTAEALVRMVGEAGGTLTLSSPGFTSRGQSPLDTDVTVIYQISAQSRGDLIFLITDDWMPDDGMCLTVFSERSCAELVGRFCGVDSRRPTLTGRGLIVINFTASAASHVGFFRATLYFAGPDDNAETCTLPITDCRRTSRPLTCASHRKSIRPDMSLLTGNGNGGVYVDCVWVLRSRDNAELHLQIVTADVGSEDFALSIHGGLTSTDAVVATVWGTNVARSSVEDRCFYANGTVPTGAATTARGGVDVGNDTVLVGQRGFYVRLRGYLHAEDAVVFHCWTQQLPDPFTKRSGMLRSLSDNGTTDFRSGADVAGADRSGQCGWTLRGASQCAHVLIPFGFAVTLMWIGVLWIVVRVLRRRRPAAVVDSSSSLCYCRSLGRRDVLAWTAAPDYPSGGSGHPTIYYVTSGDVAVSSMTSCWSPTTMTHLTASRPPPYDYDDVIKSP